MIGVEKESPADRAGILEGDVILRYADRPVSGIDDLHRLLTEEHIGKAADANVLRGQETVSLSVIPEEASMN